MASSKSLSLLFIVLVLLISSEVEAAGQESMADGVEDAKGNGRGDTSGGDLICRIRHCRHGCFRRCPRGCIRCCRSAQEAPDAEFEDGVKN